MPAESPPVGGARPRPAAVLVTRPPPAGPHLAALLEAAGFEPHLFPVLELLPPDDPSPLRLAASRALAGVYDWIVLTSANGVRAFSAALAESGEGAGALRAKLAVVGAATAAAAGREGWSVSLVPEDYTGEGLLEAFAAVPVEGAAVLLPVAAAARDVLSEGLRARGARVEVVTAYRMGVPGPEQVGRLRALLRGGALDLGTLASPSAAEGLLELAGPEVLQVPVAVIGPVTAAAAEALGYHVVAVATPHTGEGLVAAVVDWVRRATS